MRSGNISEVIERWSFTPGRFSRMAAEKGVCKTGRSLREKDYNKVLDLGCGTGRHALWFARAGFDVYAYDSSPGDISVLKKKADADGLKITASHGEINRLPFSNSCFDYVLAWDTLANSHTSSVQQVIGEVYRILKPGGIFQGTFISKRNTGFHPDNKLAYMTDDLGKRDILFCYNAIELVHMLTGFEILKLKDKAFRHKGPFRWHFVAEKIDV